MGILEGVEWQSSQADYTVATATLYPFKQRIFFPFEKHSVRQSLSTHTGLDAWAKKSIFVLLKSLQGKANPGARVKTKPYQVIFAFLCVPIVVVVLLVKSFSPKVAELLYRAKKKHGVKILCKIKQTLTIFFKH